MYVYFFYFWSMESSGGKGGEDSNKNTFYMYIFYKNTDLWVDSLESFWLPIHSDEIPKINLQFP